METSEIAKLMGIAVVGTGGGLGIIVTAVKLLIPVFAKARLDANSLGSASVLIDDLRAEKKALQDELKDDRERHEKEIEAERSRFDVLRSLHEQTLAELYKARALFSELENENIRLTGEVNELQRQVRALQGVKDA